MGAYSLAVGARTSPLRQELFESLRERLHDVVVDDEDGEEHQGGEADLRDALLELDAQVAADGAFDQQQHDNAAVEHRDREQVEDTEVSD